ncbi:MAG: hypothetical protein K2Q11_10280 [Burkholderiaceae bacterium]|nr:hypothetical protein [Burkholderiaceae bacterium]
MKKLEILSWIVGLLGFALVVTGVALFSIPLGCIIAGILLLAYARLADKAAAAMPAKPEKI